jgi:hypothetical protein
VYVFTDSSLHKTQCVRIHRLITTYDAVWMYPQTNNYKNTMCTYSQTHHYICTTHCGRIHKLISTYNTVCTYLQTHHYIQYSVYVFTVSSLYTKHCVPVYGHNIVTVYVYISMYVFAVSLLNTHYIIHSLRTDIHCSSCAYLAGYLLDHHSLYVLFLIVRSSSIVSLSEELGVTYCM